MRVEERALTAKYNLYQKVGIENTITKDMLKDTICKTGLVPTSRVIKSVIAYMRDHRHLGERNEKYYIIYRKKDKANPKSISNLLEKKADINYFVSKQGLFDDDYIYPVLFNKLVESVRKLKSHLKEKGECLIKFQTISEEVKMADNVIQSAIDFLKKVKSEDFVTIRFQKKDGTMRVMKCTLKFDTIPDGDKPKSLDLPEILKLIDKNILHVYDIEKKAWRSVLFDKVQWLDTPTKERFFVKKKV